MSKQGTHARAEKHDRDAARATPKASGGVRKARVAGEPAEHASRKAGVRQPRPVKATTMSAANFKAKCLGLLDQVAATGRPVIVTKHGKPVAQLVPLTPAPSIFGCMAHTLTEPIDACDDLFTALPAHAWTADAENFES